MSRCEHCKKKLGIIEYKCKCEKLFCIKHLHYEEHNCKYNYKQEKLDLLKKQLEIGPLISKIEKI
jgi:recombinational DNA repair protein (RecF pathway)